MWKMLALAATLGLAGCQTAQMDTASGGPEVTIRGARPDQIKPAIVSAMLNTRLRIKSDTQYSLVFEKQDDSVMMAALFGTGYGPPVHRVSFAIAEVPGGTRVVADSVIISNAGSGYERRGTSVPEFPPERLQTILNELSAAAVTQAPPPIVTAPAPRRAKPAARPVAAGPVTPAPAPTPRT